MGLLEGKTVLVTGASKGIGSAIAASVAADGAHVVAHYGRDRAGAEAALMAAPQSAKTFLASNQEDPTTMDALWESALAATGRIDCVVLNAAVMLAEGGIDDVDAAWDKAWDRQWRVNVLSPARLMRNAVRHFRANGGGVLVTISSWVAQRGSGSPATIAYAASKAALKAAAQTVARGYAKEGVLSYIVAPGVVRTRMSEDFAAIQGGEEKITSGLAMGEWVPPSDIGALVAFLATGRIRHLTGATIDVNGASYVR
jgi:NAD(P)-dependent dehydrogenase (short-subunit alcohol dehydrogenase family)